MRHASIPRNVRSRRIRSPPLSALMFLNNAEFVADALKTYRE